MPTLDRPQTILTGRKIIQQEVESLQDLSDTLGEGFWQCAQVLVNCQGLIWVTAVGTSSSVGARLAHILTCAGARSMFLSPSDGLHGHTGIMTADDLLIALSRGGESAEVIQMVQVANSRRTTTLAFVHKTDSTLARLCKYVLPVHSRQEYELMGYLATTSTVAFAAISDALCALVLEARGVTPESFALTHPGGAVGKVLGAADHSDTP